MLRSSQSIVQFARALTVAQGELPNVPKGTMGQVGNQRRPYADLASATETARPILAKHGLGYVQGPSTELEGHVTVTTRLIHESGEWIEDSLSMPTGQGTPQAIGSAITYARRYALMAMLGLAADDDDGQAASEPEPVKPVKKAAGADAQTKKAMALFGELGITDRAERLKLTSAIVGREVESWNDLKPAERNKVIDDLESHAHPSDDDGQG